MKEKTNIKPNKEVPPPKRRILVPKKSKPGQEQSKIAAYGSLIGNWAVAKESKKLYFKKKQQ
jgi:hypothetical protein